MPALKIAFFTEAGSKRGMGHLVRTYTLYKKALSLGFNASFYLDSDVNYDYAFENLCYFSFRNFQLQEQYDVIFIDSYIAPLKIYNEIAKNCKVPVYLDDYARLEYPHGIIINFAPDAKNLFFQKEKKEHVYLLGLPYLVLREEVLTAKVQKKKQIFIMLGGADTQGLTYQIVHGLKYLKLDTVVVCNDRATVTALKKYDNITILYKPTDKELIKQMAQSTLAITTASMSVYELAYLNTSSLIIAITKNQSIGVKQLISHKLAAAFVDITERDWVKKMAENVQKLFTTRILINTAISTDASQKIYSKVLSLCKNS
ncbi:hypothetical protein LCX93_00810 [Sulfurimonas sp. SWIR-19]|uniref:hypothetical protein n=1 Tax=Sulfurimonas sp. SWIR-19 TaxID=2878390 RepID=UPI001CF19C8A|nr:hypothetical protein [Sulfurimonas sp. SWIR-19]UCN00489.1 hypothetical protein LCX93_00810 [Sulfurimonas sp. SWIR-19]